MIKNSSSLNSIDFEEVLKTNSKFISDQTMNNLKDTLNCKNCIVKWKEFSPWMKVLESYGPFALMNVFFNEHRKPNDINYVTYYNSFISFLKLLSEVFSEEKTKKNLYDYFAIKNSDLDFIRSQFISKTKDAESFEFFRQSIRERIEFSINNNCKDIESLINDLINSFSFCFKTKEDLDNAKIKLKKHLRSYDYDYDPKELYYLIDDLDSFAYNLLPIDILNLVTIEVDLFYSTKKHSLSFSRLEDSTDGVQLENHFIETVVFDMDFIKKILVLNDDVINYDIKEKIRSVVVDRYKNLTKNC